MILFSLDPKLPGDLIAIASWLYPWLALVTFVPKKLGLVFTGTCLAWEGRLHLALGGGEGCAVQKNLYPTGTPVAGDCPSTLQACIF